MRPDYVELGPAVFESVLMDQLRVALEHQPDRITLSRLEGLLGHALCRARIDADASSETQLAAFLSQRATYVALVRDEQYVSLIEREVAEHAMLRQLLAQSQPAGQAVLLGH